MGACAAASADSHFPVDQKSPEQTTTTCCCLLFTDPAHFIQTAEDNFLLSLVKTTILGLAHLYDITKIRG